MKGRILVVDDEKTLRYTFEEFLTEAGYETVCAKDHNEALEKMDEGGIDVIFTDIILGGKTGIDLLREVKLRGLTCPVIVITGYPDVETAANAVRLGAFDYVRKPVEQETLLRIVGTALKFKEAVDNKEVYRANLDAIFSSVREGIISVDNGFNAIEVNESAVIICGLKEHPGGKPFTTLPGYCHVRCADVLRKTLDNRIAIDAERVECRREDRPFQVVSVSTSPLFNRKGDFKGAIMVVSDESRLAELERNLNERRKFTKIVGRSKKIQEICSLISTLANLNTTVLIFGESGTGKELVAEALYLESDRKNTGPYITVNCAAIPENLIESELFGHERGSFTGAAARQIGKFELANNGVILLDEIGDMSLPMQSKLLRVLEKSEFHRIGGREIVKTNARVVAATNKDLREKVRLGEFRSDLYYRLKVAELDIPPLRERETDIPDLVSHFLKKFNRYLNKNIQGVSNDVQKLFMEYRWPGNVRELEHVLEYACILCNQSTITIDYLPRELKGSSNMGPSPSRSDMEDEPLLILQTLEKTKWNKAKAAGVLGINRSTLYRKMEKYGIS